MTSIWKPGALVKLDLQEFAPQLNGSLGLFEASNPGVFAGVARWSIVFCSIIREKRTLPRSLGRREAGFGRSTTHASRSIFLSGRSRCSRPGFWFRRTAFRGDHSSLCPVRSYPVTDGHPHWSYGLIKQDIASRGLNVTPCLGPCPGGARLACTGEPPLPPTWDGSGRLRVGPARSHVGTVDRLSVEPSPRHRWC